MENYDCLNSIKNLFFEKINRTDPFYKDLYHSKTIDDFVKVIKINLEYIIKHKNIDSYFLETNIGKKYLKKYHIYTDTKDIIYVKNENISIHILKSSDTLVRVFGTSMVEVLVFNNAHVNVECMNYSINRVRAYDNSCVSIKTSGYSTVHLECYSNSRVYTISGDFSTIQANSFENSSAKIETFENSRTIVKSRDKSEIRIRTYTESSAWVNSFSSKPPIIETFDYSKLHYDTQTEGSLKTQGNSLVNVIIRYGTTVSISLGGESIVNVKHLNKFSKIETEVLSHEATIKQVFKK